MIRNRLIALSLAATIASGGTGSTLAAASASAAKPVRVELAPPKTKPGNKCHDGTEGCEHGKFTGNFFGD